MHRAELLRFLGPGILCLVLAACGSSSSRSQPVVDMGAPKADMASPKDMGTAPPDMRVEDMTQDLGPGDMGVDHGLDQGMPDLGADMASGDGLRVEVIKQAEHTLGERRYRYELVRVIDVQTQHRTYVQWIEPMQGVKPAAGWPVMVTAQPYVGISWSEEPVDERWAARGSGFYPDDSEPSFDPTSSSSIVYDLLSPEQIIDQSNLYLINGIAALHIFGRFYAGGSIEDDRQDMQLGMRYLAQRQDADGGHVGVFGGSWGGYEAVYAINDAPASVRPLLGVVLFPLTDFVLEWRFTERLEALMDVDQRASYRQFFEPYRRRIVATTKGGPDDAGADFSRWTHQSLAPTLKTPIYVIHDDEDTLVPFEIATDLAQTMPAVIKPVWVMHQPARGPEELSPSHGPDIGAAQGPVILLLSAAAITRLIPDQRPLYLFYDEASIGAVLDHFRAQQGRGQSLGVLPALLADIADPRVSLFDVTDSTFKRGDEEVAKLVNARWGTTFTAADVAAQLRALSSDAPAP